MRRLAAIAFPFMSLVLAFGCSDDSDESNEKAATNGFELLGAWQWNVVESGKFHGYGFASTSAAAQDACTKDAEATFVQLANRCCEGNGTDVNSAPYAGRCDVSYSGSLAKRRFSGLAAYLCWPTNTTTQLPTGYWQVVGGDKDYGCKELVMVPSPTPTPSPTVVPSPSPTITP